MDLTKYDKRIIERNLKNGNVTVKEHNDYLKSLGDLSEEAEVIHIPLYPWDMEADDQKVG